MTETSGKSELTAFDRIDAVRDNTSNIFIDLYGINSIADMFMYLQIHLNNMPRQNIVHNIDMNAIIQGEGNSLTHKYSITTIMSAVSIWIRANSFDLPNANMTGAYGTILTKLTTAMIRK